MPKPANTTARGYGAAHQAERRKWAPLVAAGTVVCWRCGWPIHPGQAWDLGHDDHDRSLYRGPEHRHRTPYCPGNRAAGATVGNRKRGQRRAAAKATIRQPPTAARWFTSKRQTKVCPICGATFTTTYDSRTCGRTCGLELRRRNAPPKPPKVQHPRPTPPPVTATCTECGATFTKRWRTQLTCDDACAAERNRRRNRQAYQLRVGLALT